MSSYEDAAQAYIERAEEVLPMVVDPGQKATVCALLALANAVLETDSDIYKIRTELSDLNVNVS